MQTHNLHVPLPENLHADLRAEARRSGEPATQLAREGIQLLITERKRQALRQDIAAYAADVAGTLDDFDQEIEAASIEHLDDQEVRR